MVFESSMEADPSGLGFSLQKLSKISGRWNGSIDGAAGGAGGADGAEGVGGVGCEQGHQVSNNQRVQMVPKV